MHLRNIKVSFLFNEDLVKTLNSKIIWKNGPFAYTIYRYRKNLLNITGAKSKEEIHQQKINVEKLFNQKVTKVRIDNVFFSQKNHTNLDMCALYNYLRQDKQFFVDYNIEIFAGMYLHPRISHYPTIVIFRTGSYQIMGGKSLKAGYRLEIFIKKMIHMFEKKLKKTLNIKLDDKTELEKL